MKGSLQLSDTLGRLRRGARPAGQEARGGRADDGRRVPLRHRPDGAGADARFALRRLAGEPGATATGSAASGSAFDSPPTLDRDKRSRLRERAHGAGGAARRTIRAPTTSASSSRAAPFRCSTSRRSCATPRSLWRRHRLRARLTTAPRALTSSWGPLDDRAGGKAGDRRDGELAAALRAADHVDDGSFRLQRGPRADDRDAFVPPTSRPSTRSDDLATGERARLHLPGRVRRILLAARPAWAIYGLPRGARHRQAESGARRAPR